MRRPIIGYIVVDYAPKQHATRDAADAERERLERDHPHKKFRTMKILNASGVDVEIYEAIRKALEDAA